MRNRISGEELHRVLDRARVKDASGEKIEKAIELIDGVLEDLGEEAVASSFNGGKDCTVSSHIFAAVSYARHTGVDSPHAAMPDVSVPSSPVQEKEPTDEQRCIWDRPLAAPPPLPHIPNLDSRGQSEHATHHEPACSPSPEPDSPTSPGVDLGTSVGSLGEVITGQTGVGESDEERRQRREARRQAREAARERRRKPRQLLRSVYFTAPNPFPELEAFVLSEVESYGSDSYRFGGGMKAALGAYLSCEGGKDIKAISSGTRQNDPNGKVEPLAPTDPSWPQVLRVHPVSDWSYAEVWDFSRELDVPTCILYDEGYTSSGSTHNTSRNPLLANGDGSYRPAWMLQDPSQERAGRIKSKPPTACPTPAAPAASAPAASTPIPTPLPTTTPAQPAP